MVYWVYCAIIGLIKIMSLALKRYLHENVMLAFAPTLHEDLNHGLQQKKNIHL
jgi:hypothetical protein